MFKRPMLEGKSLYEVIEGVFHEKVRVAEEEFYASIARPADARLLGIGEGAPVLDLERVTYNMHNEIIEYTLSVARATSSSTRCSTIATTHNRLDDGDEPLG